jgi:hypothetical protein
VVGIEAPLLTVPPTAEEHTPKPRPCGFAGISRAQLLSPPDDERVAHKKQRHPHAKTRSAQQNAQNLKKKNSGATRFRRVHVVFPHVP